MRLGIFGTGYAGLVTSVCLAQLGHTVKAIDKNPDIVARLSDGLPTIHEPGLKELLREGSAVRDFLHPDRIVIGADSGRARSLLLDLYQSSFDCPIIVTSVTTAELIKQTANAFLATKISFINLVSDLCEKLDVDVAAVAKGIGLDPRIGGDFLRAGPGFRWSGPSKEARPPPKMTG